MRCPHAVALTFTHHVKRDPTNRAISRPQQVDDEGVLDDLDAGVIHDCGDESARDLGAGETSDAAAHDDDVRAGHPARGRGKEPLGQWKAPFGSHPAASRSSVRDTLSINRVVPTHPATSSIASPE